MAEAVGYGRDGDSKFYEERCVGMTEAVDFDIRESCFFGPGLHCTAKPDARDSEESGFRHSVPVFLKIFYPLHDAVGHRDRTV